MTMMALINTASSDFAVTDVTTLRAYETIWPAPVEQGTMAMRFRAILFEKLWQTESSLELNLIIGHDALLYWLQVQYAPPRSDTGSVERYGVLIFQQLALSNHPDIYTHTDHYER